MRTYRQLRQQDALGRAGGTDESYSVPMAELGAGSTEPSKRRLCYCVSRVSAFAQSHPQLAPDGRLGFAYIQRKLPTEVQTNFNNETALILQRLAAAITLSYAQGGGSPVGACYGGWCDGYPIDGATFNDGWQTFAD